jgi:DnaJ-class molecular chaperone
MKKVCDKHNLPVLDNHDGRCALCIHEERHEFANLGPFTCPVCNGAGTVSRPPHVAGDQTSWGGSTAINQYPCRACNGSGILWRPM